jgi:hypothetical protein
MRCDVFPACKEGDHKGCIIVYGNMKCPCTCHKVIGIG